MILNRPELAPSITQQQGIRNTFAATGNKQILMITINLVSIARRQMQFS